MLCGENVTVKQLVYLLIKLFWRKRYEVKKMCIINNSFING